MSEKFLPFDLWLIQWIEKTYPTPFHLYSEEIIRSSARELIDSFSWLEWNFKNYFALKACPNPHILKILKEEWMWSDCSSIAELAMSSKVWLMGENIIFTSNNTLIEEFKYAKDLWAIINLDDITHISKLESIWFSDLVCCRYNPWALKDWNDIIWNPVEAKYWMTKDQLIQSYITLKNKWVKRFWLHTMIVSNMKDENYIIDTARILFDLAIEIFDTTWIKLEFVNLGWGIWIPYRPEDKKVDVNKISQWIKSLYYEKIVRNNLSPLKIFMENGRFVTGPGWFLITKVINVATKYRNYIWVDASMSNLMRPGMYWAYHHITVLGKENLPKANVYDVTGSLCENNDKFAVQRSLPQITEWDYLAIHDTWAHGYAMWFQYNWKLRSSELLLKKDWTVQQIRRAETLDDYFSTLDFTDL